MVIWAGLVLRFVPLLGFFLGRPRAPSPGVVLAHIKMIVSKTVDTPLYGQVWKYGITAFMVSEKGGTRRFRVVISVHENLEIPTPWPPLYWMGGGGDKGSLRRVLVQEPFLWTY